MDRIELVMSFIVLYFFSAHVLWYWNTMMVEWRVFCDILQWFVRGKKLWIAAGGCERLASVLYGFPEKRTRTILWKSIPAPSFTRLQWIFSQTEVPGTMRTWWWQSTMCSDLSWCYAMPVSQDACVEWPSRQFSVAFSFSQNSLGVKSQPSCYSGASFQIYDDQTKKIMTSDYFILSQIITTKEMN